MHVLQQFPASSSILAANYLGAFLQAQYKLSNKATCKLIRSGINDTYLIADSKLRFVFRVYSLNWRSRTEIEEEHRLLRMLNEHGVSVSYPVIDMDANYLQCIQAPEGQRFGTMFTYASGEKTHLYPSEMHHQIGVLMAQMHKVTVNQKLNRVTYTPDILMEKPLLLIGDFLPADTDEMKFMQAAKTHLLNELSKCNTAELRIGAVHMDCWFDNLNISAESVVTLFDFDFCGNGWLCLDVAYYVLQVHSIERDEAVCKVKVDAFLAGYESITQLSAEEKRLLPALGVSMYFFYLGIQCQRFENWSNSFLSENYLKRYINGLVKRYFDMYFPPII